MTRKDYKLIARQLHETRELLITEEFPSNEIFAYDTAVSAIMVALQADNPRFDCDRFMGAVAEGKGI